MASRKKSSSWWIVWGLLVVGILATPVALRGASVLALSGPDGLTMLYPFVQIVKSPILKIPGELGNPAAQWMMYLQFPLYGLLMGLLARSKGFWAGLGVVFLLHFLGVVAATLLNHFQNPYLRF